MADGNDMFNDLKFEELIENKTPFEQFLARTVRDIQKECNARKYCPASFALSKRQVAAGIGSVTGISTIIYTAIEVIKKITVGG